MLIRRAEILAFDKEHGATPFTGDIRIEDGVIVDVGADLTQSVGDSTIDAAGKLVAPGFVNAHLHSQEALFRGRYERLPLELWMLYAYPIIGVESLPPELVYLRTLLVGIESLRNGVTTVVDDVIELPTQTDEQLRAVFRAYDDLGMRANVSGHVINKPFIDTIPYARKILPEEVSAKADSVDVVSEEEYIEHSRSAFKTLHGTSGRLRYVLAPSTPQRCTDSLLTAVAELARQYDAQYHVHVLETKVQAVTAAASYGKSMVRHLDDLGVLDRHVTFAHSVWVSEDDMAIMAERECSVAHNPVANLKLGAGIAPFRQLRDAGVNVALGTDGICNGSARMFDVIRTASLIHNVRTPDFERWPASREVLAAATMGGARSCLLDDVIGSIEPGKSADLVVYNLDTIAFTPLNDLCTHLAYSEDGSSVDRVLVAGNTVYDNSRVTGVDESAVVSEFRERAAEALSLHNSVEVMNAVFHNAFNDVHKFAAAYPYSPERYSSTMAARSPYGLDSSLYRL